MRLEQYTADAICRAMGFPGFIDPALPSPSLRLLLKPSFDPEVCITLSPAGDRARLSVVAFASMFWHQTRPVLYLPAARDEVLVSRGVVDELETDFTAAHAATLTPARQVVICDGMGVECSATDDGGVRRFAESVVRPEVVGFVDRFIWWAWTVCQTPRVRNALAACGRYVGKNYKRDIDPGAPAPVQVMVLGTLENRADLRAAVQKPAGEVATT